MTGRTTPITESEAVELLRITLKELRDELRSLVNVPLTSWQEGALLSWQFNVGTRAMRGSTLLTLLNQRFYASAGRQLLRWNKATIRGRLVVLPGLQNRRNLELSVYGGRPVTGVLFKV